MQGLIAGLSRTPGQIRHAGRPLGADTEAVLAELDATGPSAGTLRGDAAPRSTPRGGSV